MAAPIEDNIAAALMCHSIGDVRSDIASSGRANGFEHGKLGSDISDARANILSQLATDGRASGTEHCIINKNIGDAQGAILSQLATDGRVNGTEHNMIGNQIGDSKAVLLSQMGNEGRANAVEHNGINNNILGSKADLLSTMCMDGRANAVEHNGINNNVLGAKADLLSALSLDGRQSAIEHSGINSNVLDSKADLLSALCRDGRANATEHSGINNNILDTKAGLLSQMCMDGRASAAEHANIGDKVLGTKSAVLTELCDARAAVIKSVSEAERISTAEAQSNKCATLDTKHSLSKQLAIDAKESAKDICEVNTNIADTKCKVEKQGLKDRKLQEKIKGKVILKNEKGIKHISERLCESESRSIAVANLNARCAEKTADEIKKELCETQKHITATAHENLMATYKSKHSILKNQNKQFCAVALQQEKIKSNAKLHLEKNKNRLLKTERHLATQAAVNAKVIELGLNQTECRILKAQEECCCDLKALINKNACDTRDLIAQQEISALRNKVQSLQTKLIARACYEEQGGHPSGGGH